MGGFDGHRNTDDVEALSLSGLSKTCSKPSNFPITISDVTGASVDGKPTVCGGSV